MQTFDQFIRFFLLSDDGKLVPKNGVLPTSKHGTIPAIPGDVFRFLVPPSDLGDIRPESVAIHLKDATGAVSTNPVGIIRRQDAENYSEIRLRVNSAVAEGDYRQFALLGSIPNPDYEVTNLALGRVAQVSSTLTEPGLIGADMLTDGLSSPGGGFWTSNLDIYSQHDEWLIIPLSALSRINSLTLFARMGLDGNTAHFPQDVRLEVSVNGIDYHFVRQWVALDPPGTSGQVLALPTDVDATHLRVTFSSLRYNPAETTYRVQLSELAVTGYPLAQPPMTQVSLLGTFRGQQAELSDYVREIRNFFESYIYTPVTVDEDGSELVVRMYHSDRFQLGNVAAVVGIGTVNEQNLNEPRLSLRFKNTIVQSARTRYRVSVGRDIAEGNAYTLGDKTYTASRTDSVASILQGLGVVAGTIEADGSTTPVVSAIPGVYSVTNRNKPGLTILFDHQSGDGLTDFYKVIIGSSVQVGNIYQVSVEGTTTKTYVVEAGDIANDVAAFFNVTSGTFGVSVGRTPVGKVDAGTQIVANSNAPSLTLTGRTEIAAETLDCYDVFIGNNILAGNTFSIQQNTDAPRTVVAETGDSPLSIAAKFGYDTHPFVVGVATGDELTGFAEPGPRYRSPDNLAKVEVLSGPILHRNLPYVAELQIPLDTEPGTYSLSLATDNEVAQSNLIDIRAYDTGTLVIRYGDAGPTYGMRYEEAGLVQQIRLPIALTAPVLRQNETLGTTPEGKSIRGQTSSERMRTLTTRGLPASFHNALWAALKHRTVWINAIHYQQQGEYTQSQLPGRDQLMQGTATVVEVDSYKSNRNDYKDLLSNSTSIGYALIAYIDAPIGLPLYLETDSIVHRIRMGDMIAPDVYRVQMRCGGESLTVAIYVDNVLALQSLLTPGRLNRIDEYLIVQAGQQVSILATPADNTVITTAWLQHRTGSAYSDEYNQEFRP